VSVQERIIKQALTTTAASGGHNHAHIPNADDANGGRASPRMAEKIDSSHQQKA